MATTTFTVGGHQSVVAGRVHLLMVADLAATSGPSAGDAVAMEVARRRSGAWDVLQSCDFQNGTTNIGAGAAAHAQGMQLLMGYATLRGSRGRDQRVRPVLRHGS